MTVINDVNEIINFIRTCENSVARENCKLIFNNILNHRKRNLVITTNGSELRMGCSNGNNLRPLYLWLTKTKTDLILSFCPSYWRLALVAEGTEANISTLIKSKTLNTPGEIKERKAKMHYDIKLSTLKNTEGVNILLNIIYESNAANVAFKPKISPTRKDKNVAKQLNKNTSQESDEIYFDEKQINGIIKEIEELVSSVVAGYNVGITKDSIRRRGQYASVGIPNYKILYNKLSSKEAGSLEKKIFNHLMSKTDHINYDRYRSNARGNYRENLGGRSHTDERIYDFYVAWWEEGDEGFKRR